MCGRFTLHTPPGVLQEHFGVDDVPAMSASYNIAPSQDIAAVRAVEGRRSMALLRWGLLPSWAKEVKTGYRMINARAETVADKPAYRTAFRQRRCLIPADGFYEWKRLPKGKLPHYIYRADGRPLALAGIWASWKDPDGGERVATCSIITGRPNDLVADIHDRMPVILEETNWETWLDRTVDDRLLLERLLAVHPEAALAQHPVSTLVNKVSNNYPECIDPLDTPATNQ